MIVLDEEWNEREVLHWYLAQIAWELRRISLPGMKRNKKLTVKDCLIKFEKPKKRKPLTREEAIAAARERWGFLRTMKEDFERKQEAKAKQEEKKAHVPNSRNTGGKNRR